MIKKLFQFINQNTNFLSYSSEEKQLFLKEYSLSGLYLFSQDPSPFIRLQQRRKIEIQQQRNQELKGIMRQLVQLLQPLNDNYTIPAFLFLKGPLLGELLYDPPAIRNTSDIDLFISLDKVPQAFSLLGASGFTFFDGQPLSGDYLLHFLEEDASGTIQNSHFRQITNGTHTIEIHGALFKYAPSISVEEHIRIGKTALKHAQQIQSEEFHYPFLDITDLLIQLCYHFARHFIDGIHYIACEAQESYPLPFHNLLDIALLLEHAQNQLDISEVVTRAENYHCLSTTLFTLKCIEDIFGLQTYKMLIEKLVQENLDIADITSLQSYITDEEDLFFFKAIELLSIKDIFSQSWSNVLDKIRKNFSPIRRYFCSKNAKQAFKMHCKSNVSAAYSFNWKVYCHPLPQKTSLTLEWQIFNRDIYLNEPSALNIPYAQSPTEPSMGKALSPVLGFVFSSNNCQCKQKHCAANYELRMYPSNNLQNKIECVLYQIESLQDFPITIDTTFYCYTIEYSTNSILVRLTLNDLSLFVPYHSDHIISSNQNYSEGPIYFDISCDFGARGNHPRCFLSWSMQKYYRPTSCTYCGLLEIQR